MQTASPARRRHRLTWLLFLIAVIEAAAIVAFAKDRALATVACGSVGIAAAMPLVAPPAALPGTAGSPQDAVSPSPDLASPQAQPESPAPSSATPPVTATNAAPAAGDVRVSGDTNQIVDPKCVANAAASLLTASAPPATPSCGPMKQPEALKAAEKQISQ